MPTKTISHGCEHPKQPTVIRHTHKCIHPAHLAAASCVVVLGSCQRVLLNCYTAGVPLVYCWCTAGVLSTHPPTGHPPTHHTPTQTHKHVYTDLPRPPCSQLCSVCRSCQLLFLHSCTAAFVDSPPTPPTTPHAPYTHKRIHPAPPCCQLRSFTGPCELLLLQSCTAAIRTTCGCCCRC